jgi:serine phosphatase RsbU (regulator of sigma subunit)
MDTPNDNERQLAREVQERTYPKVLPRVPGFDVHVQTQPAEFNNGDFIDAIGVAPREDQHGFVLDPNPAVEHLVLALGDATGHGMASALMATELRAMLRASIRLGVYHRDLVEAVNTQLVEDLADNHFITMLMGRLIRESAMYRWVSFGQGPLWFWRAADQTLTHLPPHGPPLGILPDVSGYAPTETVFEPGDLLVALSDGFPETMDAAGELLGDAAFAAVIRDHAATPLPDLHRACLARAQTHQGALPQRDDRTFLAIRRN